MSTPQPTGEYEPDVDKAFDDFDYGFGEGCSHCDGGGWNHGCIDDLCRGSNEPEECPDAFPCRYCNPGGHIR